MQARDLSTRLLASTVSRCEGPPGPGLRPLFWTIVGVLVAAAAVLWRTR